MTASGIHTYKLYAFYIPAALMIISLLIFMFKVTLTEKKHAKIVAELELRYSKK
jgi:lactose/raffinose/galactose permease